MVKAILTSHHTYAIMKDELNPNLEEVEPAPSGVHEHRGEKLILLTVLFTLLTIACFVGLAYVAVFAPYEPADWLVSLFIGLAFTFAGLTVIFYISSVGMTGWLPGIFFGPPATLFLAIAAWNFPKGSRSAHGH